MNRYAKWIYLLTKRLYKKIAFLAILLLIPLIVLGIGIIAKQDSGFMKIALAQEDMDDALSDSIIAELEESENLILYNYYDTPEDAREAVESGKADAAWIFPKETKSKIDTFVKTKNQDDYIVTVVEREENVLLKLSHEKLASAIYKHCAQRLYINFVRDNLSVIDHISDERLMEYYDSFEVNTNLFEFTLPDENGVLPVSNVDYITAPIRGLLAVIVLMCGLAAALFYMKDQKNGTFGFISDSKKPFVETAGYLIAVLNVAVVVLAALALAGVWVSLLREILLIAIYIIICVLFCMLIRRITVGIKLLASILPLIAVASIVICPVFMDFKSVRLLQILFPPTYYINSVYNNNYIWYSLIYAAALALLIGLYDIVKSKRLFVHKKS